MDQKKAQAEIESKKQQADQKVSQGASAAHETVDKIADATHKATDRVSEKKKQIQEKEQEWMESMNNYVRENPCTSIAIAVAGGFLLSRVMSGR